MKSDDIEIELIRQLQNGRKPIQQIAEDISIAKNTARAKINKLQKDGIVNITGLVDADKIPNHMLAIVAVKLKTMNGEKKAKEMSKLKGVAYSCAVTGRYDLMLIALLNESFTLSDFISGQLDKIDDILSVETFVVYKNCNLLVPYVL